MSSCITYVEKNEHVYNWLSIILSTKVNQETSHGWRSFSNTSKESCWPNFILQTRLEPFLIFSSDFSSFFVWSTKQLNNHCPIPLQMLWVTLFFLFFLLGVCWGRSLPPKLQTINAKVHFRHGHTSWRCDDKIVAGFFGSRKLLLNRSPEHLFESTKK